MAGMKNILNLNVFGITAQIITDDYEFFIFVTSNYTLFPSVKINEPNITVFFSLESGNYAKQQKDLMERFGEGLHRDNKSLYWENEFGFAIFVDLSDPMHWRVLGYHFDLCKNIGVENQMKNYTRSMRWMIHFPIFSMLEQFQGKRLVHASAISKDGNAIVLAGLNKVGKSSLARYLFDNHGFKYLSDNFLLTDGEMVYAFPEKGRLSPESLSNLNVTGVSKQIIYGKHHISVELENIEIQANPECVFIVCNHEKRGIIPISQVEALKLLESMHRFLQEFPEYSFYSLLDSFEFWSRDLNPLFSDQSHFFKLTLPLDWSIKQTSEDIINCILKI